MKYFKHIVMTILILLLAFDLSFAAESNYDETVVIANREGVTIYSGTTTFADSGSGDAYYTQAMYIGGQNTTDAKGRFICSEAGTEDVNVLTEYSFDGETFFDGETCADLDALGTTAVIDTIGTEAGAVSLNFDVAPWMRFKFVAGQAINSTTVSWALSLKKQAGLELLALGKAKDTQ